jgi:selenocysteine lyase/cysteine desulfurase
MCLLTGLAPAAPVGSKSTVAVPDILLDERFGDVLRPRLFLRDGLTQFNHGSFGTVPRDVMEELHRLQEQCEDDPDTWIQQPQGYRGFLDTARAAIAQYVGVEAENLVFVENASAGCNAFLRSLSFQPGDKVLYLNTAYGMVKNILFMLEDLYQVELIEVDVTDVVASPDLLLDTVALAVEAAGGPVAIALGVICHIASIPGIIQPVEGFVDLLPGVPVMVDGAHAPGAVPLQLSTMLRQRHLDSTAKAVAAGRPTGACAGCAGYIGNIHKWLYGPKGTALLYVTPEWQDSIVPPTLSGCRGDFVCTFEYTGTRDYAPFASVPAALAWRTSIAPEEEVMDYGHQLALWSGAYLAEQWGTSVMEPPELTGWMTNIRWPTDDSALAGAVSAQLLSEYGIRFNVYTWAGGVYTRLSAQVYLQMTDVERVGALILELLAEAEACGGVAGGSNSSSVAAVGASSCEWVWAAAANATQQGEEKRSEQGDGSCASQFV